MQRHAIDQLDGNVVGGIQTNMTRYLPEQHPDINDLWCVGIELVWPSAGATPSFGPPSWTSRKRSRTPPRYWPKRGWRIALSTERVTP
jgi:hypothetical protein